MLVIHMGLLVHLLNIDSEQTKFYDTRLSLISVAIILQIIAGLTALIIANMQRYFSKYKEGCCSDFLELCGCVYQSKKDIEHQKAIRKMVHEKITEAENGHWDFLGRKGKKNNHPPNRIEKNYISTVSSTTTQGNTCCCVRITDVKPVYEEDILQNYEVWQEISTIERLSYVTPQSKLKFSNNRIQAAKTDIEVLENEMKIAEQKHPIIFTQEKKKLKDQLETQNDNLEKAERRRDKYQRRMRNQSVFREQGKILAEYAHTVQKNHVTKCVSVWQHVINYLLYAVFILNTLIVAFGSLADQSPAKDC